MRISAVITAAGLSSRMGEFKPLLMLNGFPMISMTAASLMDAGVISPVTVVGKSRDKVTSVLQHYGVNTVLNSDPEHSDMLDSIRLGMLELPECDAFFVLPGDMPLISAKTMHAIIGAIEKDDDYILPVFCEKNGHPPLIRSRCAKAILTYTGLGGLKGALSKLSGKKFLVNDPGVLMDADTPEDFSAFCEYAKSTRGITLEMCEAIYELQSVPESIRAHCRTVGSRCREMAAHLNTCGCGLDTELCVSAGLLHDIFKSQERHNERIYDFLVERGYLALAKISGSHKRFSESANLCDEASILTLADRTTKGTDIVTPTARYAPMLSRFPAGTDIGDDIRHDFEICTSLYLQYQKITCKNL